MSEITLKSGKVVKVDVSDISRKEWMQFISPEGTKEYEDFIIQKCTGLSLEDLDSLPIVEFKRIVRDIVREVQAPDPS